VGASFTDSDDLLAWLSKAYTAAEKKAGIKVSEGEPNIEMNSGIQKVGKANARKMSISK
jgi:hypothetical protein